MHTGEFIAVMQPNGHWHLVNVNFRFPNGALDVTQSAERMAILLARTKGVPLTLVGFRPDQGHARPGGRRPGIEPYASAAARRIPHRE